MDQVTEILATEVAYGITLKHFAIFMGVAFVLWIVLKFLGREKVENKLTPRRCTSCNWKGPVGKQTRQCPKCGGRLAAA